MSLGLSYLIYSAAAITLTGILARTLYNNGKIFLSEVFDQNSALAAAVNNLLVIGFYMLNLGYSFIIFRADGVTNSFDAIQNLVSSLGILLLSLGVIHFINMGVFWRIRRNVVETRSVPATFTSMVPPPPVTNAYAGADAPAPY